MAEDARDAAEAQFGVLHLASEVCTAMDYNRLDTPSGDATFVMVGCQSDHRRLLTSRNSKVLCMVVQLS